MRKIAIRGPAEAVAKAKALVEAQVHYAETAAVHHVSQTLEIPKKATGLIIGRGGATVKGIEADSGAMLNIDTKHAGGEGEDKRVGIIITGTAQSVDKAAERINAILREATNGGGDRQPSARGQGGGSGTGGERLEVPTTTVAMIIGKAGKNIRDLEAQTGARPVRNIPVHPVCVKASHASS